MMVSNWFLIGLKAESLESFLKITKLKCKTFFLQYSYTIHCNTTTYSLSQIMHTLTFILEALVDFTPFFQIEPTLTFGLQQHYNSLYANFLPNRAHPDLCSGAQLQFTLYLSPK